MLLFAYLRWWPRIRFYSSSLATATTLPPPPPPPTTLHLLFRSNCNFMTLFLCMPKWCKTTTSMGFCSSVVLFWCFYLPYAFASPPPIFGSFDSQPVLFPHCLSLTSGIIVILWHTYRYSRLLLEAFVHILHFALRPITETPHNQTLYIQYNHLTCIHTWE